MVVYWCYVAKVTLDLGAEKVEGTDSGSGEEPQRRMSRNSQEIPGYVHIISTRKRFGPTVVRVVAYSSNPVEYASSQ